MQSRVIHSVAKDIFARLGSTAPYEVGTMIEVPRGALRVRSEHSSKEGIQSADSQPAVVFTLMGMVHQNISDRYPHVMPSCTLGGHSNCCEACPHLPSCCFMLFDWTVSSLSYLK